MREGGRQPNAQSQQACTAQGRPHQGPSWPPSPFPLFSAQPLLAFPEGTVVCHFPWKVSLTASVLVGSLPPHCILCPPVRLWSLTLMQPLPLTYLSPLRGYKLLRTKATPVLLSSQASGSPQHLPRGCCSEAFLNECEQKRGEGAGRGKSRRWSRKASRLDTGGREVQVGGWVGKETGGEAAGRG